MTALPESVLAGITGRRLPGGCDDCLAYQVLSRMPNDQWGAVYVLTVHHDDTCPVLTSNGMPPDAA